jgi:hypothetical protein
MGIDPFGLHIAVSQQLLNRADVGALLLQVCGERMAEGVAGGWLAELRCHTAAGTPEPRLHVEAQEPPQPLLNDEVLGQLWSVLPLRQSEAAAVHNMHGPCSSAERAR